MHAEGLISGAKAQLAHARRLMLVALVWLCAGAAQATPEQDLIKLSFGSFDVYGTYSKKSCAAQTFLTSARGQRLGSSIYWVPGRALYVMTKHPGYAQVSGAQTVQFRFPDGQAMAFKMKRKGTRVQASIGFGATARKFYKMMAANNAMQIELVGVQDTVSVNLDPREQLEGAMRHCRDWLRS